MQLSEEQRRRIIEQIAAYEAKRDQLLAEANLAQGAALALRGLLEEGDERPQRDS